MTVTFTLPVLVRVTGCWLLDPTVTLLKLMLVGVMLSCGLGAVLLLFPAAPQPPKLNSASKARIKKPKARRLELVFPRE